MYNLGLRLGFGFRRSSILHCSVALGPRNDARIQVAALLMESQKKAPVLSVSTAIESVKVMIEAI